VKFEDKKPREAETMFRKALLLNPELEPVYYDLAAAQINQNLPTEALSTLEKARDKFKPRFITEFYTALAYSRMKDYTNAIKFMTAAEVVSRVSETNRLNHLFYFQLGATYERMKQTAEAEKCFLKTLDLAPDFPEALNYLGYMWAERNVNLDEARKLLERAVKVEPKNGAYLDSLGWVYYKLGRLQDALRLIQQAIRETEEPDGTLYDHLGDIYNALNQPEKAREAWRKALTLNSIDDKAPVRKKLEESTSGATSR
jgi:tetratricopeptide (TPR) repeat protein